MNRKIKVSAIISILFCLSFFVSTVVAGTTQYQYDDLHRLTRVERSDGTVTVYEYDDLGNRISKVVTTVEPDTDNDGLPDFLEDGWCTDPLDADTDDDGIIDGDEDSNHNGQIDQGETNPCEIDSDGDGIQDGTESGYTLDDIWGDTDTGIFQPDLDPLTTTSPFEKDSDGDLLNDGFEDINHNGRVDIWEPDPNSKTYNCEADLDNDGDVDGRDLSIFVNESGGEFSQEELIVFAAHFGHTGLPADPDDDGILNDGDFSGIAGDSPCTGGETVDCDDNCPDNPNPDQADSNGNGIGDVCD